MDHENTCPCCGRHCPQDDLHCLRGRAYFGLEQEPVSEDSVIVLLRKCGHLLHHGGAQDLDVLTAAEKAALEGLLQKVLDSWQTKKC